MASILVLLTLIGILGLAVAGLASSQLALSSQQSRSLQARSLAEAALTTTCARLLHDPHFGIHGEVVRKHFRDLPSTSEGFVSFDSASGPWSVNNLWGSTAVPGWSGATVPVEQVHLIGVGRHGGIERRVEAVLHMPQFPYVLASSGPIRSGGGLELWGVRDAQTLAGGLDAVTEQDKVGGDLACNGHDSGGQQSLILKGSSSIQGDVQSTGSISIDSSVRVGGETRPNSDPVVLPQVDLHQFDPAGTSGLVALQAASLSGLTVDGYTRRAGDLNVAGPLELQGGVLYVDGNLEISGGIKGVGAVIVTGKTTVRGAGSLQTDQRAALLSKGDVVLEGTPTDPANFRGLVYTEGDFSTTNVNIVGSFVANRSAQLGGSQVHMENTRAVSLPSDSNLTFAVTTRSGIGAGDSNWSIPVSFDLSWDPSIDWRTPPPTGSTVYQVIGHPSQGPGQPGGDAVGGNGIGLADGISAGIGAIGGGSSAPVNPDLGPVVGNDIFAPPGAAFSAQGELNFDPSRVSLPPDVSAQDLLARPELAWGMVEARLSTGTFQGQAFLDYVRSQMNPSDFQVWLDTYQLRITSLALRAAQEKQPAPIQGTTHTPGQTFQTVTNWSLDFSKFVNTADRLRVLLWHDL